MGAASREAQGGSAIRERVTVGNHGRRGVTSRQNCIVTSRVRRLNVE